jgi:predicted tellurium resistance membrane protein TerC
MAFTEAQLLADLITSNPAIKIIAFIPVGTTATDVYVEGVSDSKFKTGPMIQIAQTNTAAQAHAIIDAAMS